MISLLLARKIFQLFLIMILGYLIVKTKVFKSEDSSILAKLSLYVLMPCVIINAFQVEFTADVRKGLILAFVAGVLIHIFLIVLGFAGKNLLGWSPVEEASIVYSNAANLIIPIISTVLGPEWVVYTSAFFSVQMIFIWTHGVQLFVAKETFDLKKILLNINILSILIGIALMLTHVQLPAILTETLSSVGDMLGPVSMLITGMIVAGMDLVHIFDRKRIYMVLFFRLIAAPGVVLLILKLLPLETLAPNAEMILLISFLATAAPSASMITQFAQLYDQDPKYASSINITSTLACIVTMPVFVYLYYL